MYYFFSNAGEGMEIVKDGKIGSFFAFRMTNDSFHEVMSYKMHMKAVKKFGQLDQDQVFGFFPALSMGGERVLKNVKVVQLREYLTFLAQIAVENNQQQALRL
jgi:hypothetical protein